jgi:enoyl-CoA hydratase
MQTYEILVIEDRNGVLIATINRPKALNALNQQTMQELRHFFTQDAPNRAGVKGIVLVGGGEKAFVAGADISEFTSLDAAGARAMAVNGQDIFFAIERFPKPVIAAVTGFALGGGCELAMACHLRIANPKARFGQPEVNLGILPGYGGTQRLVQLVGKGKALELMMTADMIGGEEAHRLGLVNHLVEAGQEVNKSVEIIEKIATKAPLAIAGVIRAVDAYFTDGVNGYEAEIAEFTRSVETSDFKEGATAFLEKRAPKFGNA